MREAGLRPPSPVNPFEVSWPLSVVSLSRDTHFVTMTDSDLKARLEASAAGLEIDDSLLFEGKEDVWSPKKTNKAGKKR